MVSGSADNTLKLWLVSTGKCLHTWEFPTAVKRVAFSDDDEQVVCITEQRMGHQGAIRVFNINREGESRELISLMIVDVGIDLILFAQNLPSLLICSIQLGQKQLSARSLTCLA